MQAILSFDQAPPISAPLRFFVTAPLFGLLAGLLMLWQGPELFISRWTPGALALTHLLTAGFMLQVMLGAMIQVLPVVAGANLRRPLAVARTVHAAIVAGALCLAGGFLTALPAVFLFAALLFGAGIAVFVAAAGVALFGVASTSPTIAGLKQSVFGLTVAIGFGISLALVFGGVLDTLPVLQVADLHLAWGLVGWGLVLLAAVAYVVVPMFQLTPPYPKRFAQRFCALALGATLLWTLADLGLGDDRTVIVAALVVGLPAAFAGVTLGLQRRSKRPRFDATQHLWRWAMLSALAAALLWATARASDVVAAWNGTPLLIGVLAIYGGFVSVITGMLNKIVPFLVWLHLQNAGGGRVMAPNMKKIIGERALDRQMIAHFIAYALLIAAVAWPEALVYPAGVAMVLAFSLLFRNLWAGLAVYRHQRVLIRQTAPAEHGLSRP